MTKDFQKWHILKTQIDTKTQSTLVNEREICYVSIGENIGFEQNGKNDMFERPVLVLRKFWVQTFIGIPLTSKPKNGIFYHTFTLKEKPATAILSQIRLFDTKRIERRIGYINETDFTFLKTKLRELLKL